jgi:hypothetical protein
MGPTTHLRRELRKRFVPHAVERGFVVDERHQPVTTTFRRAANGSVQIFEIQWDKYGRPRFAVRFGTCPAAGLRVDGTVFPPGETLATWCPDRGTLRSDRGEWFRQDVGLFRRMLHANALRNPSEVINELLACFPELERYWAEGRQGPHARLWGG